MVSVRYEALFSNNDGVRFSMVQPLHIESGALGYTGMAVTDRETGELGVQSDTWELGGRRPVYAEVIYATELGSSNRRLSVFSRQQLSGDEQVSEFSAATSGMRFEMRF